MCSVSGDSFEIAPTLSDSVATYPVTIRLFDGTCTEDYNFNIIVENVQNTAPVLTLPFTTATCLIDSENGATYSEDLSGTYTDADTDAGYAESFTLSLVNSPTLSCISIASNQYLVCNCNDNALVGTYTTTVKVEDSNAISGTNLIQEDTFDVIFTIERQN